VLPDSLMLWVLLQRLPGYTVDTLDAEDHALVEDWMLYLNCEAHVAVERAQRNK